MSVDISHRQIYRRITNRFPFKILANIKLVSSLYNVNTKSFAARNYIYSMGRANHELEYVPGPGLWYQDFGIFLSVSFPEISRGSWVDVLFI